MTSLAQHQSSESTKLLLMGNSGSGKTGALTSLVKADYKLRILDYDNGLDSLVAYCRKECPDKLGNVEFRTLRDKYKTAPTATGSQVDGSPIAFTNGLGMLDNWKYMDGDKLIDFGRPSTWGPDTIVVIDSSTFFADAAFNWAQFMNPGAKDNRQIYFAAQQAFENVIALLTSKEFRPNVIVISHIRYSTSQDGVTKGFPTAVGSALGPTIPAYFNSVALVETSGIGDKLQRQIRTTPTAMIDLKNPAPFEMVAAMPIETGLAKFFETVRGKK